MKKWLVLLTQLLFAVPCLTNILILAHCLREAGNPLPKGGSLLVSSARSTASSPLFSEIDMLLTKTGKELVGIDLFYLLGLSFFSETALVLL
ncbi:unnamed protein product [Lupinus luteus]|uniref:Uncharacterized protein n=1 Tax=Lupinus luteus TaxID=3873 RepID=A0AAV1WZZ9_LUPLU